MSQPEITKEIQNSGRTLKIEVERWLNEKIYENKVVYSSCFDLFWKTTLIE